MDWWHSPDLWQSSLLCHLQWDSTAVEATLTLDCPSAALAVSSGLSCTPFPLCMLPWQLKAQLLEGVSVLLARGWVCSFNTCAATRWGTRRWELHCNKQHLRGGERALRSGKRWGKRGKEKDKRENSQGLIVKSSLQILHTSIFLDSQKISGVWVYY